MTKGKYKPACRDLLLLTVLLATIHAILFAYDYSHPDAFLKGDRSIYRLERVENISSAVTSGKGVIDIVISQGIIGDYFVHALAFMVGGKAGVLILQIAASILSACLLYLIALALTGSRKVAWVSAILYATLPHSLAYPHLLVTETFANTFLILSVFELVKYMQDEGSSPRHLTLSGIWIAASMLVRPIVILLPVFIGLAIAVSRKDKRISTPSRYLTAAFLPMLVWMSFMAVNTGHFTTGSTGSTLGYSLYLKVERMHKSAPDDASMPEILTRSGKKRVSPVEFGQYVISNPGQYFNLLKFDVPNLVLNSGVNKLLGYYLAVYDVGKEKGSRWLKIIDKHGLIQGLTDVLKQSPAFIFSTLAFTAYWGLLLLGALLGFRIYFKDKTQPILGKLIFTGIPVYIIFFTLLLVSGPRSGHRSSFDFIICLMFAIFISHTMSVRKQKRDMRSRPEKSADYTPEIQV